jgi:tape measure domain-containing protein
MAKTVGDLLIKLGVDGIEGVNVLKSSLTALGKAAGPTDKNIRKIRTEILEFANAGQKSTQAIRGVIESFKGLQAQASIGSGVFKQLAADIEGLENALESIKPDAQKAAEAMDRLQKIRFPSRVPDAFEKNMKERRRQLQGLRVDSEDYLNTLVGIRNFEAQQAARVARSEVSAAARVARTGMPSSIVKAEQPATLAALRLRIGEVQNEIENLDFTTQDYRDANKELIELQKSLSQALNGTSSSFDKVAEAQARATRRAEKLANIQQYYGTSRTGEGQAAQRAGGFRDPVTGAMIARGTRAGRVSLAQQPVRQISGLYQSIGDIGMSGISADIDRMGKSVKEVTRDIKAATAASNGSANSLQAQRSALTQLRAGLDPTSRDFRELGKEIDKVDRKLSKLGNKRFSLKGAAQTVGAVASAGIFGGAPGAAGALLGAPFGPGGAVIGGGIGTSVGVSAQQISGFTNYAASIRLAEKAMERILQKEEDQVESARRVALANEAIEYAVNRLNVEREDATVGMTRLSAAVLGAGGTIETAALAFLGTTKAIKATKGSAEDVRGGLTALVQMFSKGKISAEELSGQLGERFPAAVTAFAEANDISTSELQAMLKNGEVGLDRLVKFLVFVTKKYSDGSLAMAASAEESGERQKRSFDEVRRQLGEQLIDVGAKLQTGIADSLAELTPVIVNLAKAVAGAIEALVNGIVIVIKNFRNLIDTVLVLAGGAVLGTLITTLVKVGTAMGAKGFAFSVALLARFIRLKLNTAVGALILKLKALALTMARNPITLLALGITALGVSMFRASQRHKNFIDDITSGVMSLEDAGKRVDKYKKRLEALNKIQGIIEKDPTAAAGLREAGKAGRKLPLTGAAGQVQRLAESLQDPDLPALSIGTTKGLLDAQAITSMQLSGARAAIAGRAPEEGLNIKELLENLGLNNFETFLGGTGDKTPMSDIELALRRQMRGAMATEDLRLQAHLQLALDLTAAKEETEDVNKRINLQEQAHADFAAAMKKIKEDELKVQRDLQASLEDRQYKLGLITEQEYIRLQIERERRKLEEGGASDEMIEKTLAVYRQQLDPDFFTSINKQLAEMRRNFQKLIDPANQVIGAANAIGDAFGNSFKQVITGQASARQALANFFQSVANHFADMASQIIAEAIKMQAVKFISQIISAFIPTGGGGTGFGGASSNSALSSALPSTSSLADAAASTPLNLNAGGNYLSGGFKAFQAGGVVSQPTLGMVGEGGEPEYIIPQSKMRESMARYSRGVRGPGVIPDNGVATMSEGSGVGVATPIDVRFSVERINNVDYVTATEFQQGLQQAAAQGAQRGEQNTLKRLQMSGSTRRRLGM